MTRYVYSLLRFVPNPSAGEFVNLGAVAGSEVTGDWSMRHVENDQRAKALAGNVPVSAFYTFLDQLSDDIDRQQIWALFDDDEDDGPSLTEAWLSDWATRARNIVQLTPPVPMVADSAEQALDLVFEHMVEDPARGRFRFLTRRAVFGDLRRAYWAAGLRSRMRERCTLVTSRFTTPMDFVIGNGSAVQLGHAYSFGIASQSALANQVKAWGWTVRELREHGGRALTRDGASVSVPEDVDIEVLYAIPKDPSHLPAFEEAKAVFADLGVTAVEMESDASDSVASRAVELLGASSG